MAPYVCRGGRGVSVSQFGTEMKPHKEGATKASMAGLNPYSKSDLRGIAAT